MCLNMDHRVLKTICTHDTFILLLKRLKGYIQTENFYKNVQET